MENLKIEDGDGDYFTLQKREYGATIETPDETTQVIIDYDSAVKMVAWLNERFDTQQLEKVAGYDQSVTITVPGVASGATREISWTGDGDAPAWLERLVSIALGGQPDTGEEYRLSILRSVSAALREAGVQLIAERQRNHELTETLEKNREELAALRERDTSRSQLLQDVIVNASMSDDLSSATLPRSILDRVSELR